MTEELKPGMSPEQAVKRILIVEDEPVSRLRLRATLGLWGYEPTVCEDGEQAWEAQLADPHPVIVTDWIMPKLSGLELCRRLREREKEGASYTYVILLTSKDHGLVEGMEAGADDFIAKPFNVDELRVRLQAGVRVISLKRALTERVEELEAAIARVNSLEGLLPICSYCKNIRDEDQSWQPVERYVGKRSEASFSHSICPTCYEDTVVPMLEEEKRSAGGG
jgi:phosphoserine phosphatase RsbU/P